MLKSIATFALKTLALWGVILVTSMLTALVLGLDSQATATDSGPLNDGQSFLVVNALHALILAFMASRARTGGWPLGVLLGTTLFFAQSFLLVIEAWFFAHSVNAPLDMLLGGSIVTLVAALAVGLVAPRLWVRPRVDMVARASAIKLVAAVASVSLLYVVAYLTAGFFIAWAVPEVRAYYGDGLDIELGPLLGFQILRGAIWALLALLIMRSLSGHAFSCALTVGAAFAILASAQLLYPNAFMPWEVRFPHLVEVTSSNFIFGTLAGLVLNALALRPVARGMREL